MYEPTTPVMPIACASAVERSGSAIATVSGRLSDRSRRGPRARSRAARRRRRAPGRRCAGTTRMPPETTSKVASAGFRFTSFATLASRRSVARPDSDDLGGASARKLHELGDPSAADSTSVRPRRGASRAQRRRRGMRAAASASSAVVVVGATRTVGSGPGLRARATRATRRSRSTPQRGRALLPPAPGRPRPAGRRDAGPPRQPGGRPRGRSVRRRPGWRTDRRMSSAGHRRRTGGSRCDARRVRARSRWSRPRPPRRRRPSPTGRRAARR